MEKHNITQDGKGICGFASMAHLLIDYDKMTMSQFVEKYGSGGSLAGSATKFTNEWLGIQK